MSAIKNVFDSLKVQRNGALIGYITAGDPNPECTPEIAEALIRGGVDILELGLPFSDPIADGPTIQEASLRALNAGTTPHGVLELAKQIKQKHNLPVVIMTYFNPIFKMGLKKFFRVAKNCGVDGVIIPDLPIEEAKEYRASAATFGVDTIFLAAPSTTDDRLQHIVNCSSGFLYLVSRFGVTGAKSSIQSSTIQLVKRVLTFTQGRVPLAVGFGVSKPDHVKSIISAGADGVIVGSAFVNIISRNLLCHHKMFAEIEASARILKQSTLDSR
ncbi:TPA: tryptophan synthase subunit alpha [Candidatus Bathyarchaeota archaeon]|nr:tryptophan synthase subunit alpha [Candidatus Bathyarchaeota archaeon]